MKVAIVKQVLDTLGPWTGLRWEETTSESLFRFWPCKGLHWEMATLLRADWYIVPQQVNTDYIYDSVLKHAGQSEILRKYTRRVTLPEEIPFESYDLVITLDPILKFPAGRRTLFAYFVAEHWDWRYRKSLRRPLANADLFLAHMLDAPCELGRLPQAIAFPYVRDMRTMREVFPAKKRSDAVWADWRTLAALGPAKNGQEPPPLQRAAERLEKALGLPVAFRSFSMGLYHGEDPPRWGDAAEYLRELGKQKYYLCLGRGSGAGQGLADAACLGCLCFGEQDKAYHRLICHPETLCGDLQDLPRRLRRVRASENLQKEVSAFQEEKLRKHFTEEPLNLIEKALELKQRGFAKARARIAAPMPVRPVHLESRMKLHGKTERE
jgi:hypothetical protein